MTQDQAGAVIETSIEFWFWPILWIGLAVVALTISNVLLWLRVR